MSEPKSILLITSHKVCVSEALNPSFETIINDFVASWKTLEDHFGIGCTLKIHIIGTHLLDAIKTTGETFHNESDKVVEQAHYKTHEFEKWGPLISRQSTCEGHCRLF